MSIVAVGVLALSAGFIYVKNRNETTHRRLQAQSFDREILETLLITPYDDALLNVGGPYSAESISPLPSCDLKDIFGASRSYTVEQITEGKKITVTTGWTESNGRAEQEQLFGLVIQP